VITRRYSLEQVNEGYRDLLDGKNIRGVIIHESRPGFRAGGPVGGAEHRV
jgi:hypothetical protein